MRVAIIDLGSNSIRMNVVDVKGNKAKVLKNIRTIVRLSEGMGDEKLIRQNAVERTLSALSSFKKVFCQIWQNNWNFLANLIQLCYHS